MALLYMVVIPYTYLNLLMTHKGTIKNRFNIRYLNTLMLTKEGKDELKIVKSMEFIYGMYKPKYWYWEVRIFCIFFIYSHFCLCI